ncbi:polymorphic toxin type 8 domain-containing protein [Burkholderia gladioli]|uniref:polymorphic toxin type 8 domain-containing protein n=1 Tax=Burkholderia gladioli TaxID=28095 RepID=UPI003F796AAF
MCCDGSHGRSNKQERLKALADDPKQPRWVRGWIRNEMRHIATGNRSSVRLPGNSRNSRVPGKELAHGRGTEAKDGYCYRHSELQDADLHKTQHQIGGY